MAGRRVQIRRGTTSDHATFTGAEGELTVDTTTKALVVHDGTTAGGIPMARNDRVTQAIADLASSAAGKGAALVGHEGVTLATYLGRLPTVRDDNGAGIATGDGTTVDDAAVQAAVNVAFLAGAPLYWPAGTYNTTTSIPNFWSVRHYGPGIIKRSGVLFYIDPQVGQLNVLNVTTTGSDANDGLGTSDGFLTGQRAIDVLENIGGRAANGRWRIKFGAGTFGKDMTATDMPFFTNYLEIMGTNAAISAWATGQTIQVGDLRLCNGVAVYAAESEGTTGATQPDQPYGTVSDGGVVWRWIGGHRPWATGQVVAAGTFRVSNSKVYWTSAGGTCGATAPSHTTGPAAVSDGGVSWVFEGHYNAPPTTVPTTILSGALDTYPWGAGQIVKAGASRYNGSNCYIAAAAGTTGATAPTHTSGTVSDGTVPWRYIGARDATLGTNAIWFNPACRINLVDLRIQNWESTQFGDYAFLAEHLGDVLAQRVYVRNCSIGLAVINNGSLIEQNCITVNCEQGAWGTYNSKLTVGTNSATSCFIHNCDSGMYASRNCIAHCDYSTLASNRNGQTLSILSRSHSLGSNYIGNVKPVWSIGASEFVDNPDTANGFYFLTAAANTDTMRQDGFSRIDGVHNEECEAEIRYTSTFAPVTLTCDAGNLGVSTMTVGMGKSLPPNWFLGQDKKIRCVVRGTWSGTGGLKTIQAAIGSNTIAAASSLPATETGAFVFEVNCVATGINTQTAWYEYRRHADTIRVLDNSARTIHVLDPTTGKNNSLQMRIYTTQNAIGDSVTISSVEWFITG